MTDIVERLRSIATIHFSETGDWCEEAADEIERLRDALHSIRIHGTEEEAAMAVTALEGK